MNSERGLLYWLDRIYVQTRCQQPHTVDACIGRVCDISLRALISSSGSCGRCRRNCRRTLPGLPS